MFKFEIDSIEDFIKFVMFVRGDALTEEEVKKQIARLEKSRIVLENAVKNNS